MKSSFIRVLLLLSQIIYIINKFIILNVIKIRNYFGEFAYTFVKIVIV